MAIGANVQVGKTSARSANLALGGLSMSILLASLGTSISNVALPTFVQVFQATFHQVQWVVLAYLLAITTLIVSVGRLGDLAGRRRLLLAGLFVFTAASLACGLAWNLSTLVLARAAQGLGAAIMMALAMAFVGEIVPKERTGRAMGLMGTMSAVGTALGPTLGGFLIGTLGWPSIYFVSLPVAMTAYALLYLSLPPDVRGREAGGSFDYAGTLILAAMLGAYALSMTMGHASFDMTNVGLLAVAAALYVVFVRVETRVSAPLIMVGIFRTPGLVVGFIMSAIVTTVVMATLVVGPFYLSEALRLSSAQVGLAMSCGPIVAALAGVPAGRAVDRFGSGKVVMAGLLTAALGCAAMASVPASAGVIGYMVPLVVITAGYAVFQAANNTAVLTDIRPDQRGVISGMLNLSRNLGLITGASFMGAVFAWGKSMTASTSAGSAAASNGMQLTFWLAAILIMACIAIASLNSSERAH